MDAAQLDIDRSVSPTRLRYGASFNAAAWFVDRHVAEGRGPRIAIEVAGARAARGGRAGALDAGAVVTYAELAAQVARAGSALLGAGLAPGDRALMVVKDCPEFFAFFWGALKAGIIPVPVSYLMRTPDLAFIIRDSACRAVIHSPEFESEVAPALAAGVRPLPLGATGGTLDGGAHGSVGLEAASGLAALPALGGAPDLETAPARPENIAFWLYSSGTTGRPKGVPHRHRDLCATCEHYAVGVLGLNEEDRCFSAAKLFFAYGLGNAMTFPLWVGGTAILDERRPTPASTFEVIAAHRPTAYFGVPTLYAAQLQALDQAGGGRVEAATETEAPATDAPDISSLRLCVSAGEALPPDILRRWQAATGMEILDGIGSTEALHIFISNAPGAVRPGSTGRVVPGYEARVVDAHGDPAAPGEAGQLEIRGDSTTPGYWNRPRLTARTLAEGWLRTGDRYVRDADGFFHYQGRADDMIKVGGIWCPPFDIEARLADHPAVLEAAVVGREDEHGLTKPEAHVVLADPDARLVAGGKRGDALRAELVSHCRETLPKYMYPRWIRFVDDLPKTATGKIQRFKLRAPPGTG